MLDITHLAALVLFVIAIVALVATLECSDKHASPRSKQKRAEMAIRRKHRRMQTSTEPLEAVMHMTAELDSDITELTETIVWSEVSTLRHYHLPDELLIIIPDVRVPRDVLNTKTVARRRKEEEVIVHAGLLDWTKTHPVCDLVQSATKPVRIVARGSGCMLAYGVYCLFDTVDTITLHGPPMILHHSSKYIRPFVALNDISCMSPYDENYVWPKNTLFSRDDIEYRNTKKFSKI